MRTVYSMLSWWWAVAPASVVGAFDVVVVFVVFCSVHGIYGTWTFQGVTHYRNDVSFRDSFSRWGRYLHGLSHPARDDGRPHLQLFFH
jgi:hypothetical protein